MRKILLISLCLLAAGFTQAQEIKVKSITWLQNDLAARTHPRLSSDGKECALVRIAVPMVKEIQFSNSFMVGDQEYIPGEYKVWVYPGAKKLKFRHENFPSGEIIFADYLKDEAGNPIPIEGKNVYRIELDVPTIATTFEELIDIAREYSRNYREHTESSYYLAAVTAYDQAIGHNDCPQAERDAIYQERNRLAAIRKTAYFRERSDTLARKAEAEKGFESDDVYKYLSGEYKFISKLVEEYPEVGGFKPIQDEVHGRLVQHPKASDIVRQEVTVQRQQVTGHVSFKNEYEAIPFNSLSVYASPTAKIDRKNCRLIGRVRSDGTFTIVVPDDMKYIFVDGEKKQAHYVSPKDTDIHIVIH
ncbi:MAG: hypothetical protein IJ767_01720 [Bacteroidaceae bacterium]|nr:hypothetical protein [Bacteroidaceae bacterium]MBR1800202.1 hypothetical protein [Bacteroidaceae bacterium]